MTLMALFTAISIPYSSLLGVISPNPVLRTSLASIKFFFAFASSIVVSGTLLPMTKVLGGDNPARGWQLSFVVYGCAFVVLMLLTFWGTHERVRPSQTQRTSMTRDLRDLMKNRPWIILALTTLIFLLGVGVRSTVTAHYFKYYVGSQKVALPFTGAPHTYSLVELVSVWGAAGQAACIVGIVLLGWFARWVGKKRAFLILLTVSNVCNGGETLRHESGLGQRPGGQSL